ncbi:MAG: hypothetical protein ACHQD8_06095, partial [Chitinophagales bacterium]
MNDVKWLNTLNNDNILSTFEINEKLYYRINTEATFIIPKEIIIHIKKEYDSAKEKGGMILFEPQLAKNTKTFIAKEVVFIKNNSKTPWREYEIDKEEKKKC